MEPYGVHRRFRRLIGVRGEGSDYTQWVEQHDTTNDGNRAGLIARAQALPPVTIAIAMPVYNPVPGMLAQALDSVIAQVYPHWELCIADDVSTDREVVATLQAERFPPERPT